MTPKEKAQELIEKYKLLDYNSNLSIEKSKKCALIAIDEIQEHTQMIEGTYEGYESVYIYFVEVKIAIENN
jgi:hypothetical protein